MARGTFVRAAGSEVSASRSDFIDARPPRVASTVVRFVIVTVGLAFFFSNAASPQPIERSFDLASLFDAEPALANGGMNFFPNAIGDQLFISFPVPGSEQALWSTDGVRTRALALGRVSNQAGGFLYAGATRNRIFLWSQGHLIASDGTEAGTSTQPVDWTPAGFDTEPLGEIAFLEVRLASDGTQALIASDGTPNGTVRIPLVHGDAFPDLGKLVVVDGRAYFSASRAIDGDRTLRGIWTTDGTVSGTQLLIDPVGTSKDWSVYRIGGRLLVREETATQIRIHRWFPDEQRLEKLLETSRAIGDRIVYQYDEYLVFPAGSNQGDQLWASDGTSGGTRRLTDFPASPFGTGFPIMVPLESALVIGFAQGPNAGLHTAGWTAGFQRLTDDCEVTCRGFGLLYLGNGREVVYQDGALFRRTDGISSAPLALEDAEPWRLYGDRLLFTRTPPGEPRSYGFLDLETGDEAQLDLEENEYLTLIGPALADGTPLIATQVGAGLRVLRVEEDGSTTILLESIADNQDGSGTVGTAGDRFVALARGLYGSEQRLLVSTPLGPPQVVAISDYDWLIDVPQEVVLAGSFRPSQKVGGNGQLVTLSPEVDLDYYVGSATSTSFFVGNRLEDLSRRLWALPAGDSQLFDLGQTYEHSFALEAGAVYGCEHGLCFSSGGAPQVIEPQSLTQDRIFSSTDNGETAFFLMETATTQFRVVAVLGNTQSPMAQPVTLPAEIGQPTSIGPATRNTLVVSTIPNGGGFARFEVALSGGQFWELPQNAEFQVLLQDGSRTFYLDQNDFLYVTTSSFTEGTRVTTADGAELTGGTELHRFRDRIYLQAFHPEVGRELWSIGPQGSQARLERDLYPGPASSSPISLSSTADTLYFVAKDGRSSAQIFSIDADADNACGARNFTVCLGQRFEVEVDWSTKFGTFGRGVPNQLTEDTGYFWFFDEENAEVFVKMLDGRAITDHFWTFFAGLSDTAFQVDVFDTESGRTRRYSNPQGRFASFGDVESTSGELLRTPTGDALAQSFSPQTLLGEREGGLVDAWMTMDTSACDLQSALCLGEGSRFEVTLDWTEFGGGTGVGRPESLTQDTGYFWFFDADIAEVVVKILDGTDINGEFWVFSGSLSNVAYDMRVRDTQTGAVKNYRNDLGVFRSFGDVSGFSR